MTIPSSPASPAPPASPNECPNAPIKNNVFQYDDVEHFSQPDFGTQCHDQQTPPHSPKIDKCPGAPRGYSHENRPNGVSFGECAKMLFSGGGDGSVQSDGEDSVPSIGSDGMPTFQGHPQITSNMRSDEGEEEEEEEEEEKPPRRMASAKP